VTVRTIESVWDYPRPPRVEATGELVIVTLGGETIAESRRSLRVLETSHAPVYYAPFEAVVPGDFYGGWITSWIEGPFTGGPGTAGW
jgi:uncharacterized protein (DUF427 family)